MPLISKIMSSTVRPQLCIYGYMPFCIFVFAPLSPIQLTRQLYCRAASSSSVPRSFGCSTITVKLCTVARSIVWVPVEPHASMSPTILLAYCGTDVKLQVEVAQNPNSKILRVFLVSQQNSCKRENQIPRFL